MSSKPANRTMVTIAVPPVADEPSVYLNPGSGEPFAVVTFSPQMWLYLHEAAHARAIAAAFTKAADLLDDAARQAGGES